MRTQQNEPKTDRRNVASIFFSSCWGTFFLSFKTSTPEQRRRLSMSKWIVLNKHMSIFRKLERLWALIGLRFGVCLRPYFSHTLLSFFSEPSSSASNILFRRIELMQKKGYQVRVEILLIEKDIEEFPPEFLRVLALPIEITVRLI